MAVMDEFKEERQRMKSQPFKVRFAYFWDYHKWHVIIGIFVGICSFNLIYSMLTAKENVFTAAIIDCYADAVKAEEYTNEMIELLDIDTKHESIYLDNSYRLSGADTPDASTSEVLGVRIVANEIHVFLSPEDIFNRFVLNDIFTDLRTVLSEEDLEYYKDSFYYVDQAVVEKGDIYNTDFIENPFTDTANHKSPEGMENPIPVGIYATGSEDFQSTYYFLRDSQEVVFGIPFYVEDTTRAMQFLDSMTGRVK